MKLTPNQAPLYGKSVLSVLLGEEHTVDKDVALYLMFSGSSQHHLTSTQRVDQNTLQTVAPAHNRCEVVKVLLCASKEGFPVSVLAEENFQYVQDATYDMARFLVSSAGSQEALNAIRIMDNFRMSSADATLLDKDLTLKVQHLVLPSKWNVLGPDTKLQASIPRETLLHFTARLGLSRLASFLLQQPGGQEALSITNLDGATPINLAAQRGFHGLEELFAQQNSAAALQEDVTPIVSSEDCTVQFQQHLNVYMYTINNPQGAELRSVEHNISELQKYIHSHRQDMDVPPSPCLHPQPGLSVPAEPVESLRTEENKEDCTPEAVCPIAQMLTEMPVEQSDNLPPRDSMSTNAELTTKCPEAKLTNNQENIAELELEGETIGGEAVSTLPDGGFRSPVDSNNELDNNTLVQSTSEDECDETFLSFDGEYKEILGSSEELHSSQVCTSKSDVPEVDRVIGNPDRQVADTEETFAHTELESTVITLEESKECVELPGAESGPAEGSSQEVDFQGVQPNSEKPPLAELTEEATVDLELGNNGPCANPEGSLVDTGEMSARAGDEVCVATANPLNDSDDACKEGHHSRTGEDKVPQNLELPCSLNPSEEFDQNDTVFKLSALDERSDTTLKVLPSHEQNEVLSEEQSSQEEKGISSALLSLNHLESEPEQSDDQLGCPCDDEWSKQVDALLETASSDSSLGEEQALAKEVQAMVDLKEEVFQNDGMEELLSKSISEGPPCLPVTLDSPLNESDSPSGDERTLEFIHRPSDAIMYSPNQEVLLSIVEEPADYIVNSSSDSEGRFEECEKSSPEEELKEDDWMMSNARLNIKSEVISHGEETSDAILSDTKVTQDSPDWTFNSVLDANGNLKSVDLKVAEELQESEVDGIEKVSKDLDELINRESWCPNPSLVQTKERPEAAECGPLSDPPLAVECSSSMPVAGEPVCYSDQQVSNKTEDLPTKVEDEQDVVYSIGGVTTSSSTVEDPEPPETPEGEVFLEPTTALEMKEPDKQQSPTGTEEMGDRGSRGQRDSCPIVCEAEEEKDSVAEVPTRSSTFRPTIRSLSPFRRHSWGPGKNTGSETEINQRSSVEMLGDVIKRPPIHRRSYSLEGLTAGSEATKEPPRTMESVLQNSRDPRRAPVVCSDDHGSLVSLTEEEMESDHSEGSVFDNPNLSRPPLRSAPPLTKSISLQAISPPSTDKAGRTKSRKKISFSLNISPFLPKSKTLFSLGSSSDDEPDNLRSSTINSLGQSISEEDNSQLPQSPTRKDLEGKSSTKVYRTFSYIKNKMSSGKHKNKEKEKTKEKEVKDKDKKTINGHVFTAILAFGSPPCHQCNKNITNKEAYLCNNCNVQVHKGCRDSLAVCSKIKQKQQKTLQAQDTSTLPNSVTMRNKPLQARERPRSAIILPDDNMLIAPNRRMPLYRSLSKSMSIANIAGPAIDENSLGSWRALSQSTDSLNQIKTATESMESLTDEDSALVFHVPIGTDVMDGQLMGEFEADAKELEADSWSLVVDSTFVRQQKKEVIKRQDVIYELMQTEMHHLRTLKIMSDVYSKGMSKELQFETSMVDRIFPCLEDLIDIHTQFFSRILERKKESMVENSDRSFIIKKIGDILVNQFSGPSAERLKKTYGKFCGQHNDAVNFYKELLAREKKFQTFVRKKMTSSIVRRLGIQECILLVTQRITKYPVIVQRIIHLTKENEDDYTDLTKALAMIKEVIAAVDHKVNEYEKKTRLQEIHSRTETKAIMRLKSGQMFAKEDLIRRKLIHDGPVTLKAAAGRLKEVQAVLLSDMLVFLQEKDQKYTFASLDQKSTVIPLQKLIVREVAHEEKGLFLISAAAQEPEMYEVRASSKEERTNWIQLIQQTTDTMVQDEDEGIPSESEEDRRQLESRTKELKEKLQERDQQILLLLEEKLRLYQEMVEASGHEEASQNLVTRSFFRANSEEVAKGESLLKDALKEVESLQSLLSLSFGGALGQPAASIPEQEGAMGHISLPRRAETFGGFDSHQMSVVKGGERDEMEDGQDLRRTESDSVLKKGLMANLLLPIRKNEQVLQKVLNLQQLLLGLQAVVVQQDSFIEDQKQALSERLSRPHTRLSGLLEQEKQRSLEKHRQELADLKKQQAQFQEERRRREKEWEGRERDLTEREAWLSQRGDESTRLREEMEREQQELRLKKEEYQQDLERLRTAQRQLDKEREQLRKKEEQLSHQRHGDLLHSDSLSSQASDRELASHTDSAAEHSPSSLKPDSCNSLKQEAADVHLTKKGSSEGNPAAPWTDSTQGSTKKPSNPPSSTNQMNNPIPPRLLKLAKSKEKKSKHRKNKGERSGNLPSVYSPDVLPATGNPKFHEASSDPKRPASELQGNEEVFYC
ncbi:A-kinase anchor protein 13-like isoform X4 [Hypanus sabinus]|uniref:A-kinase anchor protein 13-like isoform X4 n=1 Tax=Hypanus sabinus TaxID=79690 RepID=UPI0028C50D2F|nr:A-kinase anchor protein 13-like isoform X4 [Hypanus sabinus]